MLRCSACHHEFAPTCRFCPACGIPVQTPASDVTGPYRHQEPDALAAQPRSPSPTPRFSPGQVLAGRYCIVSQLGKGGMGEVYRADDLTLGQSVALKFLPRDLASNPDRLARFRHEVARARRISHPHVCRVYDLAEHDNQPFLTMEYIDGENLASLLKRVGRLSEEKGIETARQLCSALTEVHEQGLLHRDLKPANVMLDGRGKVRLTDFGLAAVAGEVPDISSGTPAYMAPEQLAGKEVTTQSDLYALGLVLHELFTGKSAFEAKDRDKPLNPISGVNPVVEKVIRRCLEKEPKDRPRSAHQVAAALPGSDPLAAALAAGETPSPQIVANAPVEGNLQPVVGLALLAAILLGIFAIAFLNNQTRRFRLEPMTTRPEVLAHEARQIIERLGYGEPPPADCVYGFEADQSMEEYLKKRDASPDRWHPLSSGQPAVTYFWYRQSPKQLLQPLSLPAPWFGSEPGRVSPTAPAMDVPGMVSTYLDLRGRLIEFHAVPPSAVPKESVTAVDWPFLFKAAGLDWETFRGRETLRRWNPPVFADEWKAWLGVYPDQPEIRLRVEAGSCHSKVIFFRIEPDDKDVLIGTTKRRFDNPAPSIIFIVTITIMSVLTGGAWLAWRNWRLGRANRHGAWRLALFFVAAYMLEWLVLAHHAWSFAEELFGHLAPMLGRALVNAGLLWLIYVALEPYVRRRWPWRIVAWNRLLEGRWRDPLVGRDILLGAFVGILSGVLFELKQLSPGWLGWAPEVPDSVMLSSFTNPLVIGFLALLLLIPVMMMFFISWILVLLLRSEWLAALAFGGIWVVSSLPPNTEYPVLTGAFVGLIFFLQAVLLFRVGLLAFAVSIFCLGIGGAAPLTTDLSTWYAPTTALYALLLTALAVYGFLVSLGGRPLFAGGLLDGE